MEKILLGHGSGGKLMHDLIRDVFLKHLNNPYLAKMADAAVINFGNKKLAFTTDSFVVKPLFFSGGDIGKLAICGTVNDLTMMAAKPLFISCAMIIEEGFSVKLLEKITQSLAREVKLAKVSIVTGDVKVVENGACDGIFINTAGIGEILPGINLSAENIKAGDKIILNGPLGLHGLAVLAGRKELDFDFQIKSDCAALNKLILPLLKKGGAVRFMRDPTRGGLATTLNEIAQAADCAIKIEEGNIPVSSSVKSACEILGLDPLYIANEGKAVLIVAAQIAQRILRQIKKHPLGKHARIIGEIEKNPRKKVYLKTISGGKRIIDMLTSDALPRIC
ncbi:MAG: hydrogenase expression/formation protein HypE [Candidatus Omnitrophota bacterium]|nr:hydrogenase expression/formation protein HypE [Candidatus Omnitrophota bacterium]